jgi:very-short-patch-repair endonuclease
MSTPDWLTTLKNSPVAKLNRHLFEQERKKIRKAKRNAGHTEWMKNELLLWAACNGLELLEEYKFHSFRKYRFDFCFLEIKVAIEYQGGIFMKTKSGHSSPKGATRDADKANLAQSEGWRVLTFTAMNYKNVITELDKFNE